MRLPSWHRFPGRFVLVMVGIALLLFVAEQVNDRFWLNDFRVYWGSANALLSGEPLYGVSHGLGTGIFKYAPFIALLFAPLAILPYQLAASLQFGLIVAAFIGAMLLADRVLRTHLLPGRTAAYAPIFLTTLVVIVHLHRELHLGNINVMLLWLLLLGLDRLLAGRISIAGVLIGLAMIAKPHFVVLLPLLLLRRQFVLVGIVMATIGGGLLIPALFLGPQACIDLHAEWFAQMARHNASLIYTGGEGYEAVNTVYSFLHRALLSHFLGASGSMEVLLILATIAVSFGLFVMWNMRQKKDQRAALAFEYLLLIGLVPSLTLTDTEHFILALPLVMYLIHHLVPRSLPRWLVLVAIPILFGYGGNWEDALGAFSDQMVHYGVLGIASLALLMTCTVRYLHSTRSNVRSGPVSN